MDTQISKVIVDDCCIVRVQCQSVFPGFQVNLDLFHVVQRVTNCILKGKEFSKQFSKEFRTILQKNEGDIETNFDNFFKMME